MMKRIKASSPLPWVCIGDFNEVLHQHEHEGVVDRSLAQIAGFRDVVDVCELADLGFEGNWWTYEKRVAGGAFCKVRLDRALASAPWSEMFPGAILRHLTGAASDHCPIFLRWRATARQRRSTEDKIFRYEVMWESHEQFKPHLDGVWQREGKATSMQQLKEKLTMVSGSLETWGKNTFGHVQREIKQLNNRLETLRSGPLRQSPSYEEIKVREHLVELHHREEVMWRQRSRIQWLAKGNRNTRFLHQRASQRKKRNRIVRLKRVDGMFTEDDQEMATLTTDFYKDLYRS
jgi:hypothetical protein